MNKDKSAALLREARERFDEAYEEDHWNREQARDDLEFLAGEQWPETVRSEREADGRPILVINRMPQFLRQVTGDIRRTNPAIKVLPADGEADVDIAKIYEGLTRHIEHISDAQTVYEQSAESSAACGMGWFRVLTDYVSPGSFEQEIKIERITNAFSVYCDPEARNSTRDDARFMFVVDRVETADFEAMYPDATPSSWESTGLPEYLSHWYDGDHMLVAEYFVKEPVKRTIGQLRDGGVVDMDAPGAAIMDVVQTREVEDTQVKWYKLTGQDVLEGPVVLPTRYIPVIGVMGEEIHIGERVVRSSVIRYAKDAQRLYNYWRSAQTELIALQPKAPFMVTPKQIAGVEHFWEEANTSNKPFLPYNPDPEAPIPQRQTPPVPSSGMMQEVGLAADDMKATTGIYDAALGARSNEKSGVAIENRQIESDISTSIYVDNLAKSIAQCGRIIVDMIPKIYDTERQVRILGIDDAEKIVTVNSVMRTPDGVIGINDLSRGTYDVRISTGPGYTTQRQEAVQAQIEFIRAVPSVAAYVMDLIAKNMDWPGAEEFAQRLEALLPPGMKQVDPEEMSPEERQQAMVQQAQAMQAGKLQEHAAMIELQKSEAEAAEAAAQAEGARYDAAKKAIELAVMNGDLQDSVAVRLRAALGMGMQ
ncbi:MAG: portal protein [Pikeienuella sp.]